MHRFQIGEPERILLVPRNQTNLRAGDKIQRKFRQPVGGVKNADGFSVFDAHQFAAVGQQPKIAVCVLRRRPQFIIGRAVRRRKTQPSPVQITTRKIRRFAQKAGSPDGLPRGDASLFGKICPRVERRKFPVRKMNRLRFGRENHHVAVRVAAHPTYPQSAFAHAITAKMPFVQTHDAAFLRPRPQIPLRVFKQSDKTIIDDARRIAFVENRKPRSVKPRQPVNGRQPQITILSLNNSINRILRQPVVRRPVVNPILRPHCRRQAKAKIKTQ